MALLGGLTSSTLLHVTEGLRLAPGQWRAYKVAWIGGCVLYDREKLLAVGGFEFWRRLPADHQGEDVVAQAAVMRAYGGAGIVPSGAYHLESPTTVLDRRVEAWQALRADQASSSVFDLSADGDAAGHGTAQTLLRRAGQGG